jgi:hypothetical protein
MPQLSCSTVNVTQANDTSMKPLKKSRYPFVWICMADFRANRHCAPALQTLCANLEYMPLHNHG